MTGDDTGRFDPAKHLSRIKGGDYLEVKWRLVWMRNEHPDAHILTELVRHDDETAIFKAIVTLPTGGKATGYGSETASDFADFIEKAETKAIGRALAALGFGTQFCTDHEAPPAADQEPAPEGQLRYLQAVSAKRGLWDEALDERAYREFGVPVHGLSRRAAARLATLLREEATASESPRRLAPVPAPPHAPLGPRGESPNRSQSG